MLSSQIGSSLRLTDFNGIYVFWKTGLMYMTSKYMNYSHSKNISVYEDRLKGYKKPVLFEVPNNMKQKEKKIRF